MDGLNAPPVLSDLTWREAENLLQLRPVGLLPVGAIEPHGPHLPLDTDSVIALGIARYTGDALHRSGIPAIILPSINYSVSFVGASFPGAMPVDADSFGEYLKSVFSHATKSAYRALCVCNAHLEPAHVAAIERCVQRLRSETRVPIVFPDKRRPEIASQLGDEFQAGSRHAGAYETSIVLAERPVSVRRAELEELEPVWIDLPARLREGASSFEEAGAQLAYFGNPRLSSAEQGVELLQTLGVLFRDEIMRALSGSSVDEGS